ncbi:abortive infection system antitoxin AbiGi family protein [Nocardioides albus]|uniref:Uncharacterized protein n=1 Tax=Nocardioides albus TaxID=1841 RepID=A0A7W5A9P5_9ACTN|nr:abortive infection system antitoxin AbiGi family protein [Nocardioides albus]MBB3092152.1 hypothetical protein [Nocardioides albus]GGU46238.1 hypothetical protein GCM10007979_51750 [Nocardioides albus]
MTETNESGVLLHLTRESTSIKSILGDQQVRAVNAYGAVRKHDTLRDTQRVVCLSEIEPDSRVRLADRRGDFGLAFRADWAKSAGAAPVWYLPRDAGPQQVLFNLVKAMAYGRGKDPDPQHPLWKLTPFIDYPGTYEANGAPTSYEWSWEREWRVHGHLPFRPADVKFVCAPEAAHDDLRAVMLHRGYECPLIDLRWPPGHRAPAGTPEPKTQERTVHGLFDGDPWAGSDPGVEIDPPMPVQGWREQLDEPYDTLDDWWEEYHRDD